MCRLAYLPPRCGVSRKKIADFFNKLECSFGGDGNGYAAIGPNEEIVLSKGVKLSTQEIAKAAMSLNRQGWHIYFHTRKTSIGWNSDNQCHPFKIDGPAWKGTLCHNGTWSDGGVLAKYFDVGSDTAAMAQLIGEIGLEEIEKRKMMPHSGIFLIYGAKPGETPSHHAIRLSESSDLEYCPATGIWASDFYKDWDGYASTFTVAAGVNPLGKQPSRGVSGYGYHYSSSYNGNYNKSSSAGCDNKRYQKYWDDKSDDISPTELAGLLEGDDDWNGRRWYHNFE